LNSSISGRWNVAASRSREISAIRPSITALPCAPSALGNRPIGWGAGSEFQDQEAGGRGPGCQRTRLADFRARSRPPTGQVFTITDLSFTRDQSRAWSILSLGGAATRILDATAAVQPRKVTASATAARCGLTINPAVSAAQSGTIRGLARRGIGRPKDVITKPARATSVCCAVRNEIGDDILGRRDCPAEQLRNDGRDLARVPKTRRGRRADGPRRSAQATGFSMPRTGRISASAPRGPIQQGWRRRRPPCMVAQRRVYFIYIGRKNSDRQAPARSETTPSREKTIGGTIVTLPRKKDA